MELLRSAWRRDRYPFLVFAFGFLYAAVFAQGIPLWDDDFTSWFDKIKDESIFRYVWEWLWPVSTQPQYWGFNERPAQAFIYKFFHLISGYESWSYFFFKNVVYGLLGVTVYAWVRELTLTDRMGPSPDSTRFAGLGAALLFVTAPNPMAAHYLHSDLAPLAELLFGGLLLWIFKAFEATPTDWRGLPDPRINEQRRWLVRWLAISFCVYLSYKTKGDTRAIPLILALFIVLVRPRQWLLFAVPVGVMVMLAVPWGPGLFSKLPPWMPGSTGSEIGWMYQPASASRVLDFIFPRDWLEAFTPLNKAPLSFLGIFGPFLFLPLIIYLIRKEATSPGGITLFPPVNLRARGVLLLWIWACAALGVVSALPELNWVFRVRYGIITILPVTILIGLLFERFIAECLERRGRPGDWNTWRWVAAGVVVILASQVAVNVGRSSKHRRDLGGVMNAVDKVYAEVAANYSDWTLTLLPDFRPYNYRPGAAAAIEKRIWLGSAADLKQHSPDRTVVISWAPQMGEEFEWLGRFEGCRGWVFFDWVYPCEKGSGSNLHRYIGEQAEFKRAMELKSEGKPLLANRELQSIVERHPGHLAAWFQIGLIAYEAKDAAAMEQAFARLEEAAPKDTRVLYNRALALIELGRAIEGAERLRKVLASDPGNSAAKFHLDRVLASPQR